MWQIEELDLDAYLGAELSAELATWEIGDWHFHESRTHHTVGNWKLATETFAENYHIKTLHPTTVGPFLKNHGAFYAAMVDICRIAGLSLWRLRILLTGKDDTTPPRHLSDSIRHSVFFKGFKITDVKNPALIS